MPSRLPHFPKMCVLPCAHSLIKRVHRTAHVHPGQSASRCAPVTTHSAHSGPRNIHSGSPLPSTRNAKISLVSSHYRPIFPFVLATLLVFLTPFPAHAFWGSKKKTAEKAGAILFRDKGCAHCHGAGGIGGKKAPALTGLPKDKVWTPAKMTDQILNGGQKMPPFADSLSDPEVAQIVAYLRAKHKPIPPPASTAPAPTPAQ